MFLGNYIHLNEFEGYGSLGSLWFYVSDQLYLDLIRSYVQPLSDSRIKVQPLSDSWCLLLVKQKDRSVPQGVWKHPSF